MIYCADASPTLQDCDLSAAYYGVYCSGVSNPALRNTAINAMTDVPIAIEISSDPVFDNLVFESTSDNGFDAIGLVGGTLNGSNTLRIRGATLGVTPIDNLVYILLSDITIAPGGDLTIDPGIVVKPKGSVDVLVQGTLTMDGTSDPDSTIVFTSFKDDTQGNPADTNNDGSITSPAAGDWGQIEFQTGSSGSVTYSVVTFGGYSYEGIIRGAGGASPTISNCTISNTYWGIEFGGTNTSPVQNNIIENCTYTPLYLSVAANPSLSGNTLSNNGITAIGILGETVATNSALPRRDFGGYTNISYYLAGTLTVATNTNVTIEPAVVVKVGFYYNAITINGSLTAEGKVDSLISFTSVYDDAVGNPLDTQGDGSATTPGARNWAYIRFTSTAVDTACVMDYCRVSYGGYDSGYAYRGAVWCNSASPTITNCDFRTNGTGIQCDGTAAPLIQDNNFFGHTQVPLSTSVVSNPTYLGNTFDQNAYHVVGIIAETTTQDAVLERIEVGGPPQFTEYFPYMHLGTLTVGTGTVLTVEPGVVVKVSSGTPMVVNGGLSMVATSDPDSTIVYTTITDDSYGGDSNTDGSATSPSAGSWANIIFNSTTIDSASTLEYCLFRFGGSSQGVINLQSASPTIRNCQFEINRWGLWIQNQSNPDVESNLFRLTTYAPVSKSILAQPTFSGNAYDNNGYDALGLIGESIGQDATIHKWDLAGYTNITRVLVNTTLTVGLGVRLSIDPGVVIKMGRACCGPFVSYIAVNGGIDANGTMAEPIVFTSINDDARGTPSDTNNDGSATSPNAGDWGYVTFNDVTTDSLNVLEWCVFSYAGSSQGMALRVLTASPTFNNCTFESNGSYGLYIGGSSAPTINTCTFGGHTKTPVVMSLISDPTFTGSNNFLSTNAYNALGVIGETLAQDVLWKRRAVAKIANIPYALTGNLTAGLSSILRIEPGVVIKPLGEYTITVKRGLIAEGKADPDSLIVFTSPRDDFYGGDTNNDSTATDGSSQRWGYVQIDNEAIDDSTRFDYCVFRYATNSSTTGAINVTNAHPEISHSIFVENGIGVNFNGASGDSTKGKIERCDFMDNTYYGVKNTGMSFVVSAKNSWWGDAGGPNDPSDDTGSGGWYNPNPAGDDVTNGVDYTGYRTIGVGNLYLGDVSLNGEVRAYDSSLVLQHLALLITLSAQQQTVGDVNCMGGLSTLDASYILQYVANLIPYFPCAFDSTSAPSYLAGATPEPIDYLGATPGDFRVAIEPFEVTPKGVVDVPIGVSGSGEVLGHEYRLAFDPHQIAIDDVELTDAAKGAAMYWNVVDEGGVAELRIALASAELLPVRDAVTIRIHGDESLAPDDVVRLEFRSVRLNEQDLTDQALSSGGRVGAGDLPANWVLTQNVPNPFNPTTTIAYDIPAGAGAVKVRLTVYDVAGRVVRHLVNRDNGPGRYAVVWNGRDDQGGQVATGVYFYRLDAGSFRETRKMLLLK